jgi:hypothetical protein
MKPVTATAKPVAAGGFLAYNAGDMRIYAGKGNKQYDFLAYNIEGDSWTALSPIPTGAKPPNKGTYGCADGAKYVYVVKGNSTQEFYRYDIEQDSWKTLGLIPLGISGKKIKAGDDMEYVTDDSLGKDFIYFLRGTKNDFMRYDVAADSWTNLASAPGDKYAAGSWIVHDGAKKIYCQQAKYNVMNVYDMTTGSWSPVPAGGMPLIGMMGKSKKSKDGGSADWMEGTIYALKGGNTQEFWKYDAADSGKWTELDTIDAVGSTGKKKKVKAGGDIQAVYELGALFAFKGNKTNEFWRYGVPLALASAPRTDRSGVMGSPTASRSGTMVLAPNPLVTGHANVQFSIPRAGRVSVRVTDVTGRIVLAQTAVAGRAGAIGLDLRTLSAGVYLVRLDADGFATQQKLVVQH